MKAGQSTVAAESSRDDLYRQAAAGFGDALERLARAYEADPDRRRDLLQEIHFALWRSLGGFDGRCSLRTWVYRVAHNAAASHVIRQRRANAAVLVGLEEIEAAPDPNDGQLAAGRREALERLLALIRRLKPLDRQIIFSYLEGLDAASIGEITGLSPGNVAYQLHRRGSAKTLAGDLAPASCLDFYRRELERQRDLIQGVWSWYLGPLIPGLAFMVIAAGIANPGHLKHVWRFVSAYSAVAALAFYLVARLNRRAARHLQRRIDELDAMRG